MVCLSLRSGLSWLIGVVLVMTLLINISILIVHAGPRIRAEAESNQRLTRELVVTAIASLQETENPLPALRRLYESLQNLRHVDIKVLTNDDAAAGEGLRPRLRSGSEVPNWFFSLVDAPPKVTIVPVVIGHVRYGSIAIVSNPSDELDEIWSDVSRLALVSLGVTLVILALVLVLLLISLEPFDALRRGLADLEAGKSNVRLRVRGATEFRNISSALNSLAVVLDRVKDENRTLVNELIQVQDNERKEIARDLHDEAGPCLFTIRAGAATLIGLASAPTPDRERIRQTCRNVNEAGEILQDVIRGMLGRLRPPGLSELGLGAALQSLVASWNASRPDITLKLNMPHDLGSLDEAIAATVYRVVQEGVTNVFRHSGGDWAEVKIEYQQDFSSQDSEPERESGPAVHLSIEDNGVGIPEQRFNGFGLLGMSERVRALDGTIRIERRATGGARIDVLLPLPLDDEVDL